MMFKYRNLMTVVVCLCCSIAMAQTVNPFYVSSQSEAWTQGWKKGLGCHLVATDSFEGKTALMQRLPDDFSKGHHQWSTNVPVIAGATYRFSCMVKYKNVKQALAQFHFVYPDSKPMSFNDFRLNSPSLTGTQDQWSPMVFQMQAPAGSAFVNIGLRLNSPGTVMWDNPQWHMIKPAPDTRFNEDQQNYNLQNAVGMVRLFDAQKIADLNIHNVRYNALWGNAQPAQDRWDEDYLQKIADNCRQAKQLGIDVMLSLGYPPRWAARQSNGVGAGNLVAKDHEQWQAFIRKIVSITKDHVGSYRIMNEVNHQWDTGAQPGEYTRFLQSAYAVIKEVAPDKPVVMAGLSGTPGGFLQTMYDAGAGKAMDIAACQPYVHGMRSPEAGHLADNLRAYRLVMTANGDTSPLWVTEFGYASQPVCSTTPMQQAAYAVRSHLIAISAQAGVTRFFYYLLKDSDGDDCTETGGMYDRQWNIKPIGKAVQTLADVTNSVTAYLGSVLVSDDSGLYSRLFSRADGTHVLAMWQSNPDRKTQVDLTSAQPVQRIQWDGTRDTPATELHLVVDDMPVYLVGKLDELAKRASKPKDIGYEVFTTLAKQITPVPWIRHVPTTGDWQRATDLPLTGKRQQQHPVIAHAKMLATLNGLAVHVDIDDDSPADNRKPGHAGLWTQDCVELFINTDPEQSPAGFVTMLCNQFIATPGTPGSLGIPEKQANSSIKPRLYHTANGSTGINKLLADVPVQVDVRPDRSGYAMSFILPWQTLGKTMQPGDNLGFDIMATVSDDKLNRVETAAWFGDLGNSTDASLWGQIQFSQE